MKFGDAIQSVFSKYATFSGRARRSEYWYFILFNFLVSLVLGFLFPGGSPVGDSVARLYSLAVLIPGLAVTWRRLHDIGKSGANYFWIFLPFAGLIMLLVWLCREGTPGPNEYGFDPKAAERGPGADDRGEKPPWEY